MTEAGTDNSAPAASRRAVSAWLPVDLLFLARPVLLGPVWIIYGAGALLAGGIPGIDLLFVSLLVAGVYIHNQIRDVDSDRRNGKLFLLADGYISTGTAWALTIALWTVSLAWAAVNGERFWLYLLALILGLAYNAGWPTAWKGQPWLGLLANAGAHGAVTFVAGYVAAGGDPWRGAVLSIPYSAAVGAVYLGTTLVDVHGDEATNKNTFAVRFGHLPTAISMIALVVSAAVTAWLLRDPWMAAASVASLPACIVLAARPSQQHAEIAVKAAIAFLALAVAVRWPAFIALAAATYIASRAYYRMRFNLRYPSFTADPD